MMKKIVGIMVIMLSLLLPSGSVWAAEDSWLSVQQRDEIVAQLKNIPNMGYMLAEAEDAPAVNPARLLVARPIQVYFYAENGFEPMHIVYPLVYEGELKYLLSASEYGASTDEGKTFYNFNENRFAPQVRQALAKGQQVALVYDCNCVYLFDGQNWQLLHENFDVHVRDLTGAVLDPTAKHDTSALQLIAIQDALSVEDAYLGRLPRVAPTAEEQEPAYYISYGFNSEKMVASKINLAVDGVIVPEQTEENTTSFYLEQRPQMRSNSVFVPVRVVSEILGADVAWQNPDIEIKFGEREIKLTLGSRTAYKDGQKITLPTAPYEQDGYTYVPVRFVAEAFDCDVEWQAGNNLVNIQTKPWELNGQEIVGLAWLENMTGYSMIYELYSPYFAQKLYQMIIASLGEEVAPPEDFGNLRAEQFANEEENTTHYRLDKTLYFMVDEENAAAEARFYILDRGQGEYANLVYVNGKWYSIEQEALSKLIALFQLTETDRLEGHKEYKLVDEAEA